MHTGPNFMREAFKMQLNRAVQTSLAARKNSLLHVHDDYKVCKEKYRSCKMQLILEKEILYFIFCVGRREWRNVFLEMLVIFFQLQLHREEERGESRVVFISLVMVLCDVQHHLFESCWKFRTTKEWLDVKCRWIYENIVEIYIRIGKNFIIIVHTIADFMRSFFHFILLSSRCSVFSRKKGAKIDKSNSLSKLKIGSECSHIFLSETVCFSLSFKNQ